MSARIAKRPATRDDLVLRLYVAGDAPNGAAARSNLSAVLARHPNTHVQLEIVDVVKDPDRGLRDGVIITPLLVRVTPPPTRRVVGNLRDQALILAALDLSEDARE